MQERGRGGATHAARHDVRGGVLPEPSPWGLGHRTMDGSGEASTREYEMQVGLMAPQGWKGEYDGWAAADAWARTMELAHQAEALGFESLWVFDHFHTVPRPTDEITFESFSVLAALAASTARVRIGHMVICAGFRNPALTAKMASTVDVISGGRFEIGIGAGWKEEEWRAYGYGFPTLGERMRALGDNLEVIRAMLGPGRATYEGRFAQVRGAINVPRGVQERIPIIVGGNGERVTAGFAIRYADELNYVFLSAAEIAERIVAVRTRCEVEGRDPATLRFSLYTRDEEMREAGQARIDTIAGFAGVGLDRIICFPTRWSPTPDAQHAFAEDCRAAGVTLGDAGSGRSPEGRVPEPDPPDEQLDRHRSERPRVDRRTEAGGLRSSVRGIAEQPGLILGELEVAIGEGDPVPGSRRDPLHGQAAVIGIAEDHDRAAPRPVADGRIHEQPIARGDRRGHARLGDGDTPRAAKARRPGCGADRPAR